MEEVSVVKPAVAPNKPFNIPSKLMILLTGAVMGLILGVALVFGRGVRDLHGDHRGCGGAAEGAGPGVITQLENDPDKKEAGAGRGPAHPAHDLAIHYEPKSQAAESVPGRAHQPAAPAPGVEGKDFAHQPFVERASP